MNQNKPNSPGAGPGKTDATQGPASKTKPPSTPQRSPLFRKIDWWTFGGTALLVFIGYFLTLAPDLTLEDAGELAVGSYYAGVPHPPGYPVWTIITWLFTVLIPVSNIAWRVALASAVSAAFACGLLALVVSRGSSMIIEGIDALKNIDRRQENWICVVSGFVAGMLMGFNGYMWSQAVIVEVYTLSVLSLMGVIASLLRWVYAPEQKRYLYLALFLFGVCLTNHMSLLVAAMGIQVAIAARSHKLGRDMFLANFVFYVAGLILKAQGGADTLSGPLLAIFHVIGIGSLVTCVVLTVKTSSLLTEWKPVLLMGLMWVLGASFYLYMPLASMTNPPMNWGYARTADGFMHAIKRGQYESMRPTDNVRRFVEQAVGVYGEGAVEEFTPVYILIGLLPFVFFRFMKDRERAWIIGLSGIFVFLAFLLLILLNPGLDRQSKDLHRVFFTASHVIIAIGIGYGLTLAGAYLVTQYERARFWALGGAALAVAIGLYTLSSTVEENFGDQVDFGGLKLLGYGLKMWVVERQDFFPMAAAIFLLVLSLLFLGTFMICRTRLHLPLFLGLAALMPLHSIVAHWEDNEQRGHLFGFWFGHDMFTPPFDVYPEMARDAVLFGGTDPGRFNPTYMIFCESFTPPEKKRNPDFDRRDVYLITQNALADGTYLSYIRAHYNRSTQHDPYFFSEFLRRDEERKRGRTNLLARAFVPVDRFFTRLGDEVERDRRAGTSYFKEDHFTDCDTLAAKLRNPTDPVSRHIAENLSPKTQELLAPGGSEKKLRRALAGDLNELIERDFRNLRALRERQAEKQSVEKELERKARLSAGRVRKLTARLEQLNSEIAAAQKTGLFHQPERFEGVELSRHVQLLIQENPQSHTRIRLNRLLLEETYPDEIVRSKGGVYPDREIYTPTPDDSQTAFNDYLTDAQIRYQQGRLKPGEDFKVADGRVQVSGQVAVMNINGLLTKVIFDQNPGHEFYVEESFPLDWMFPHLTPYGIILKINREPLASLTSEVFDKDHRFWRRFSERLIGDWITYDTTIEEICEFAERVYLLRNYKGFTGDRKFIRDDNGQKAFSKLRSSIGGVYLWRLGLLGGVDRPQAYAPRTSEEHQLLAREAEFAFKQAFAFCPYSPEAVYRYVQLLTSMGRFEESIRIVETCQKFDPFNLGINTMLEQLREVRGGGASATRPDAQSIFDAAVQLLQQGQTNDGLELLGRIVADPDADANVLVSVANIYMQLQQFGRLEAVLQRLVTVAPDSPEAWYDLAYVQAAYGKVNAAVQSLRQAFQLSDRRRQRDPGAKDLRALAKDDDRLAVLRQTPEFQRLLETETR